MSTCQSDNKAHAAAVNSAESTRQVAVAAAGTQASVVSAELTFYRACLASAKTNGAPTTVYIDALRALGTWQ
jgi:hypothetical protein